MAKVEVWEWQVRALYYFWIKGLLFLLFFGIYMDKGGRGYFIITLYALINVLWEVTVLIMGWDINKSPFLDILFFATIGVLVYLTIRK